MFPAWPTSYATILLGLALAGCQATTATETPVAAAVTAVPAGPAAAPVTPDSLRLTPTTPMPDLPDSIRQAVRRLHAQLGPEAATLRPEVLEQACVGYLTLRRAGRISHGGILAVADMDLPSSEPRLWVLDVRKAEVLHRSHVAHGRGSGYLRARRFSNTMKSACTSLGFYRTQDTYQGKHGLSRRLRGLDPGQNDNALRRYVVLHAADYASQDHLRRHGQLGYSRGCPALPPDQYRAIIQAVGEGSCLFLSGPGLASKWLDGEAAARQWAARGWR
ncbi:murein L,D-transpeptidase catalytic domain family protein [Hymenobacter weizhouensis]|uniref:murein L,D-transpeptidase catalytic domain family protein n=1 Tax=Hymenobacter sp. YIM 151500-1 TaxID=2987689 RepID=UPI0022270031|nr:murein L,D-transpeptidase catalytic domain family protein [Hymenobacter sp. YIM 151500-1]UYZ62920.1 murein L,D-transpeptidase catalytic domain family protein [Hymenobacter sp. YIM 151500-1]